MNSRLTLSAFACLWLAGSVAFAAQTYESNLEKIFPVGPGGKLVLEAGFGACTLKPTETDKVQVQVFRTVKNGTQAQADQLFADHQVTFDQDGNTVSITAKRKEKRSATWSSNSPYLEVRFEITLPKRFDVDVRTAGGDIRVADLDGKLKARTTSGGITLQHVSGNLTAEDAGGDILIEGAGGTLSARTTSGAIRVQKVGGKADLSNAGGDIELGEAAEAVTARTTSGSIRMKQVHGAVTASDAGGNIAIARVEGEVTASTTSGSIQIGQALGKSVELTDAGGDIALREVAGSVQAHTTSGSIKIKSAKGRVDASNAGGDILIETAADAVKAETHSGSVRLGSVRGAVEADNAGGDIAIGEVGGKVFARTTSGSIRIKLAKGKVEARNSGGDIQLGEVRGPVTASTTSGTLDVTMAVVPTEDCRLEVAGGGIKLALPKSAALNLDARSSGGEVKSELPLTVTVQGTPRPGTLQGKLNGGGPTLFLRTTSGDIQLKAARLAAAPVELEDPVK